MGEKISKLENNIQNEAERKAELEASKRGEQVIKYWKRIQEQEKFNKKGEKMTKLEKKIQKEAKRKADLESIKRGEQVIKKWKRQKEANTVHQYAGPLEAREGETPVLREDEDIYPFDNTNGENNCWLNSVLQVLIHLVNSVQNEHYQYPDV